MVQGIELMLGHQAEQVRELERGNAIALEQGRETAQEIVDVRHMGQHIVGRHQVGRPALARKRLGSLLAEEHFADLQPLFARRLGRAAGGLNAQARDAALSHVLQQITIVGGDLYHPALRVQAKTFDHLRHIVAGMGQPGAGVGAEIGVVGIKQCIGAGVVLGLHQPALLAHRDLQRHPGLGRSQLLGTQVGVGRRRSAKVDQGQAQAGTTATAIHGHTPVNDGASQG